jgi:hypothetical protein
VPIYRAHRRFIGPRWMFRSPNEFVKTSLSALLTLACPQLFHTPEPPPCVAQSESSPFLHHSRCATRGTESGIINTGSEAFFNVDVSRVRHCGSGPLPINSESAPPLPPTVFFLAVSRALSKSSSADCQKASLPDDSLCKRGVSHSICVIQKKAHS